ncbi:Hint domain-containing protein [Jiella pacifica]|uniref:Hedgehog/Intein (Hint) domain-containing protein n=1 Tax=Jiella pacifica TaxID=2696469 RepID=A0A6N9T410_9HYPH|nr:Hint domain-containing protein [Jiella pacifica]NDW04559.1 hypothetical protein [Jiella pacifica]
MAGVTFAHSYRLTGNQVGAQFTGAPVYVYDDDQGGESLTIFGDINPDDLFVHLSVDPPGQRFPVTYVGQTSGGVIVNDSTYGRLLYTDNSYTNGSTISYSTNAYAFCFAQGTLIRTQRGDVPVQALAKGDIAVTASGTEREITWIGRRTLSLNGEMAHMAPVRVRANAFGAGVPERDVFLSPGHPVLVRHNGAEVLVPVMNLINGTTIERTSLESVTYWHVELDQHDVLLADGLPAESFFDMGSRAWFENDLDDVLANPDLVPAGQHGRCREVAIDGPLVEAERKRLADLFYSELSAQCAWPAQESYAAA